MRDQYDLVIVGGGMVGAAIAAGLAHTDLSIALLEQSRPEPFNPTQPLDLRVSALSPASVELLERLGAWESILRWRACPYARMKVWELDPAQSPIPALARQCVTEFAAEDLGESQLGHIVENRIVQLALLEQVDQASNIDLIEQGVQTIDYSPGASLITLDSGSELVARLLVAADGGRSVVRDAAGIGVHQWDYDQRAMVINVALDAPQLDITWQQFTPSGPRALLPLPGAFASLVWYDAPARVRELMSLDDQALISELHTHFPECLPPIRSIEGRAAFPLRRLHAQTYWKPGVVLAGDSAHQINPLAGQGVNLGFQDVEALLQLFTAALNAGESIHNPELLRQYEVKRRRANLAMMQTMDLFYRLFSNNLGPLKAVRNLMLGVGGAAQPLRNRVIKIASGLSSPL